MSKKPYKNPNLEDIGIITSEMQKPFNKHVSVKHGMLKLNKKTGEMFCNIHTLPMWKYAENGRASTFVEIKKG